MRSSKNRSRSKGNRNRNGQGGGNIVNRVFDSSGPEGKVRGTPQQIVDKYNQLTRDAQLANDRVAAESFQQHAEHYTRMLAEALREQEARQAQHQANQQGGGNQQGGQGGNQGGQGQQGQQNNDPQGGNQGDQKGGGNRRNRGGGGGNNDQQKPAEQPRVEVDAQGSFDAVIEPAEADSGLVETPENAPKPKRPRTRRRKADAPAKDAPEAGGGGDDKPPQEAAE
ncbi:DUF4167 domain-containing protein [Gymnodinialimonas sp.]